MSTLLCLSAILPSLPADQTSRHLSSQRDHRHLTAPELMCYGFTQPQSLTFSLSNVVPNCQERKSD